MSSGKTPVEEQGVWKPGQDTVWDDGGPKMMEGHVRRGKAVQNPVPRRRLIKCGQIQGISP